MILNILIPFFSFKTGGIGSSFILNDVLSPIGHYLNRSRLTRPRLGSMIISTKPFFWGHFSDLNPTTNEGLFSGNIRPSWLTTEQITGVRHHGERPLSTS